MIPYDALPNRDMDLIDGCVDRAVPLLPSLYGALCKAAKLGRAVSIQG